MPARIRRRYTEKFKRAAMRLVRESTHPVAQVARDLRIPENVWYRWRAQPQQAETHGTTRASQCAEAEELTRVKRELARVTQEPDRRVPIWLMCRALAVSPAGYDAWQERPESRRAGTPASCSQKSG